MRNCYSLQFPFDRDPNFSSPPPSYSLNLLSLWRSQKPNHEIFIPTNHSFHSHHHHHHQIIPHTTPLSLKKPQTHPIGNPKPPWILHPPTHPFPTTSDPHLLHLKTLSADTIPFSLRLIQVKKRLHNTQPIPTHSPVGRAVSALASVAAELHRDRAPSRETGDSYAALFRHVFSGSPNLLVSLLVLLADYFASSTENSIYAAEGESPPPPRKSFRGRIASAGGRSMRGSSCRGCRGTL
ncbi:hypothetical protein QJS10_CPA09g01612 [Acorus calamus]|uniref:Uncharacterized protein n=1 Tax=Acorus calamus TaxID=4465 RepID=A0AAV9E3M9_ACOCL|nr:hypothetical protein QJS10_CPA09g01612 [Acorus calamus]